MRRVTITIVSSLLLSAPVFAADYRTAVRTGNEAFTKKDFKGALDNYRIAEADLPESPEINYNLGGAYYAAEKYDEAIEAFTKALNAPDPVMQSQAQYNLGNTYFRKQDYMNSIKSYEESLKLNPKDLDAKYNLELARKMLKENTQAKQQNQQQQQQKQDQQNKQDQQKQDQQKQDQQQQQQNQDQQQNKDKQDQQKQQQQQQQQGKKMSKEDAERILNALKDNERDTQKKVKREAGTGNYSGKDW